MSVQPNPHTLHHVNADAIEYFYQPFYNTQRNCLDRAEILIRVPDGHGGYLDTGTFIQTAECAGQIGAIDRQTFVHACSVISEFQTYGIQELEVNFSPAACQYPHLISELSQSIKEHRVAPGCLCVEITESATKSGEDTLFDLMRQLRTLGIRLALDDFGKGHSNVLRLSSGPFQTLKLDKELIDALGDCEMRPCIIVQHIIRLAKDLGMQVVAEGVETEWQARRLTNMGCDFLQGYYFSPPLLKENLFTLLARQTAERAASL